MLTQAVAQVYSDGAVVKNSAELDLNNGVGWLCVD